VVPLGSSLSHSNRAQYLERYQHYKKKGVAFPPAEAEDLIPLASKQQQQQPRKPPPKGRIPEQVKAQLDQALECTTLLLDLCAHGGAQQKATADLVEPLVSQCKDLQKKFAALVQGLVDGGPGGRSAEEYEAYLSLLLQTNEQLDRAIACATGPQPRPQEQPRPPPQPAEPPAQPLPHSDGRMPGLVPVTALAGTPPAMPSPQQQPAPVPVFAVTSPQQQQPAPVPISVVPLPVAMAAPAPTDPWNPFGTLPPASSVPGGAAAAPIVQQQQQPLSPANPFLMPQPPLPATPSPAMQGTQNYLLELLGKAPPSTAATTQPAAPAATPAKPHDPMLDFLRS